MCPCFLKGCSIGTACKNASAACKKIILTTVASSSCNSTCNKYLCSALLEHCFIKGYFAALLVCFRVAAANNNWCYLVSRLPFEWYVTLENGLWWKIPKNLSGSGDAYDVPPYIGVAPERILLMRGEE